MKKYFSVLKISASLVFVSGLLSTASAVSFDVTSVSDKDGSYFTKAEGTSNGVGWSIDGFKSWDSRTTTDGTYDFSGANFSPELLNTDRLHTFGTTMDIVFDQAISSILFYLKENGGNSTLDFGLVPTLVSGSLSINGTKVTGTTGGGVVRFSGLNTNHLVSTTSILDGMDAAWVVESTAHVPDSGSSLLLLGMAFAAVAEVKRRMRS